MSGFSRTSGFSAVVRLRRQLQRDGATRGARSRPPWLAHSDSRVEIVREDRRLGRPPAQAELPEHPVEQAASASTPHADSTSSARAVFESAVRRSIGIGKTIVELLFDPISSSVCR
jgi:hypothetical protein